MEPKKISAYWYRNVPAYFTLIGVAALLIVGIYYIIKDFFENSNSTTLFILIAVSVMAFMMTMFGAYMLNLFKMQKAFEKIANGESNVKIPEVWCPVLTATSVAIENLSESKIANQK